MTRKDYVLLAAALKEARDRFEPNDDGDSFTPHDGMDTAAMYIADALARNNLRFDRDRFLKACGVQS